MRRFSVGTLVALSVWLAVASPALGQHYFTVTVRNKLTAAPLSGIRVRTYNDIEYVTGADGMVRFYEADLMGGTNQFFFRVGRCVSSACQYGGWTSPTTCTVNADCNVSGGTAYVPPNQFWGPGATFAVFQQGRGFIDMCPVGSTCTPSQSVGSNQAAPLPPRYRVQVVDPATGRGVPNVGVFTSSRTVFTDSAGNAPYEDAMGSPVSFTAYGFGYGPTTINLTPTAGGNGTINVTRSNVAERLYRVTGEGIYYATRLFGLSAPIANPMLNTNVVGLDTAQTAIYQNKVFWIWGDTGCIGGSCNFRASGATSLLPSGGGLDPSVGVNVTYYANGSLPKEMCPNTAAGVQNPPGFPNLLCWMFDLVVAPNASATDRLFARYTLVNGGSSTVEEGLARFNDGLQHFEKVKTWTGSDKILLRGHPIKRKLGSTTYAMYMSRGTVILGPFNWPQAQQTARVAATESALLNSAGYESYTPLQAGSDTLLDLNPDGSLKYTWKTGTRALGDDLTTTPVAPADQKLYGHEKDPDSGTGVLVASTSSDWNDYRQRYAQVMNGFLSGEVYYLEGDTPMGPWVYLRKVVSHVVFGGNYTFYNMRHHGFFNKNAGKNIFFEGTYTTFLLPTTNPTARENYNQVMYGLDVDTVVLPVPVYDLPGSAPNTFVTKRGVRPTTNTPAAAFMAPDRAGYASTVPVYWTDASCKTSRQLVAGGTPTTAPLFWALPASTPTPPSTTTALYEYSNGTQKAYSVATSLPGYTQGPVVAYVWKSPIKVALPIQDYLRALVADAGTDVCKTEFNPGSGALVLLNGSGSTHSTGTISSYQWTWAGGSATGVSPGAIFPAGLHEVTLTTTGSDGATSTDTTLISVGSCAVGCCDPSCC